MTEKENEDGGFSSVVLALALVLYITIVCLTFAGLVLTKPTVGIAFLDFAKDYGAIVAGIPVLIAVLVAKQQLDAGRRQHVASVKRSFKKEIDAINEIKRFNGLIKNSTQGNLISSIIKYDLAGEYLFVMPTAKREEIRTLVRHNTVTMIERINQLILGYNIGCSDEEKTLFFQKIINHCNVLGSLVDGDYMDISQYWS